MTFFRAHRLRLDDRPATADYIVRRDSEVARAGLFAHCQGGGEELSAMAMSC
jgi:hypothetical protein